MRKASPVNIDLESISAKPTCVANDDLFPDMLIINALVSDQMDQRSSSSQTQRTTKNQLTNNYLPSTVSVIPMMPIRVATHALSPEKNPYIC